MVENNKNTDVDLVDELTRLSALCRLGSLAADGLHGLHEDVNATALGFYFDLLRREIDDLRIGVRRIGVE